MDHEQPSDLSDTTSFAPDLAELAERVDLARDVLATVHNQLRFAEVLHVGVDGSAPASRALQRALDLLYSERLIVQAAFLRLRITSLLRDDIEGSNDPIS